jgi:uncharacterized protein YggE
MLPTAARRRALACLPALLAGFAVLAAPASAQQSVAPEVPQVIVNGFGEVAVPPDRATIDVAVETRAATAAAAAAQNARRLNAVLDTLRARGVAATDLSTVGFAVHPDYAPSPRGEAIRRGYVATNVVRIETRRLDQVGPLLDAALAAGANRVNEVRFASTRHDAVRDSAITIAIANARRTAETMARAGGGRLGALLELSTSVTPYAVRESMMRGRVANQMMGGVGGGSAIPTSIAPDELAVSAAVVARWRFEPGGR